MTPAAKPIASRSLSPIAGHQRRQHQSAYRSERQAVKDQGELIACLALCLVSSAALLIVLPPFGFLMLAIGPLEPFGLIRKFNFRRKGGTQKC